MASLEAGRGAHARVLTKYIRPRQEIPYAGHRSKIVLLDFVEGRYHFYFEDNNSEEVQTLNASSRYVQIVSEGDPSLFFQKEFKEPKISWAKSEAKKLLFKDLVAGIVPLESKYTDGTSTRVLPVSEEEENPMKPLQEIYAMRPEYAKYDYAMFSSRLSSLRKTTSNYQKRAADDQDALDVFIENHPISYHSHKGYIQWQGSEAQRFLREDLRLGSVESFETKKEFWMSRPAYRNFPLKEFRDKIDQEVGTEKYICQIKEKGKKSTYRYT